MLRGEAERYRINDAVGNHGEMNMYSVGLVFAFGRESAPAPRPMVAQGYEAPMVAPPPPPPLAVVAPPPLPPAEPAPPRRVRFSADTLFSFDCSALGPQGRVAPDQFSHELARLQFDAMKVEGQTDRLGSRASNEKLSMRRAEAVKRYLVLAGAVNAGRISAVGIRETQPMTQPGDCRGMKANPQLIACLQPDRRVEVEVTGIAAR